MASGASAWSGFRLRSLRPPADTPRSQVAYTSWRSLDPEIHLTPTGGGPVRRLTYWGNQDTRLHLAQEQRGDGGAQQRLGRCRRGGALLGYPTPPSREAPAGHDTCGDGSIARDRVGGRAGV
ncbi:hypothetical protein CLM82_00640, partial [Streptomyces albidoflavus]|uniref:hypothetical protein n=1 Tax=Streptomyces albidoflavus TaxID=1886 RepID=UPI000BCB9F8E